MAIAPGTRLGPYEVIAPLGAGGMGEVYRARDARLGREVAIKVLPAAFSADADRLRRFEQEARAAGMLNHPNILTIYDIGTQEGAPYIVSELLAGEELRAQLNGQALPARKAVDYALQIAQGLAAAHEKGIVHRDLKPENLFITNDGRVKILDFGLAKLKPPKLPGGVDTNAPTSVPQTDPGVVMGTVGYMSPEQVRGGEADHRSDLFAFGAILYEMLAGRRAFWGETAAETMTAILKEEPPELSATGQSIAPALERVVRHCLEKSPEQRFQSATDLGFAIEALSAPSGSQVSGLPTAPPHAQPVLLRWRSALLWSLGALVIGGLATGVAVWKMMDKPAVATRPVARLILPLSPAAPLDLGLKLSLALSPDGSHFVYVRSGSQQLYLRSLEQAEAQPMAGTEGAEAPFFSPDGQWVGFFAQGKLKKVSVAGGVPVVLCDVPDGRGGSWGTDDTIILNPTLATGLFKVSASGGTLQELTPAKSGIARWPEILPGGKAVIFSGGSGRGPGDRDIAVQSLETGERRVLIEDGVHARYANSGHLIFGRAGSLLAAPFDLERLEVTGPAVPVLDGVMTMIGDGAPLYAISAVGSLIYLPSAGGGPRHSLVWVDRQGAALSLSAPRRAFRWLKLSPDGRTLAVHITDGANDIWAYEMARGAMTRLTFEPGEDEAPIWTPDGKQVAYSSSRTGQSRAILWRPADGGAEERLMEGLHHIHLSSWSSDGKTLAFEDSDSTTGWDIWLLPLEGERKAQPFLRTQFNELRAKFSPDGRYLAYQSDESGRAEIYVQPLPGPGGKQQISIEGGMDPAWAPNGRELFYRHGDKMMAVSIETSPAFSASAPRLLFEGRYEPNYDVAPDGQRFLMIKPSEQEAAPTQLNVILEWFEELKRRVPPGKNR
jgi:serine/threonine-protein kinase